MATTARVVGMKAHGVVEPEKPAEVGKLWIDGPAEPRLECGLDSTGEAGLLEGSCNRAI